MSGEAEIVNAGGTEKGESAGAGISMNPAGTNAAYKIRGRKKQNATLFGFAIAFALAAGLVLVDQAVWGISLGASVVVITLVRAFVPPASQK